MTNAIHYAEMRQLICDNSGSEIAPIVQKYFRLPKVPKPNNLVSRAPPSTFTRRQRQTQDIRNEAATRLAAPSLEAGHVAHCDNPNSEISIRRGDRH